MIICIVGPTCAGKSTAAFYLSWMKDIPAIEASDYVEQRFKQDSCDNKFEFVESKFKEDGYDVFCEYMIHDIEKHLETSEHLIVCGFRAPEEVQYMVDYFDIQVATLCVYASSRLRFIRCCFRDESDMKSKRSIGRFAELDRREFRFGVPYFISSQHDVKIENEGGFEEFSRKLDNAINDELI